MGVISNSQLLHGVEGAGHFLIFQFLWVGNDLLVAITFASGTPNVAPITSFLADSCFVIIVPSVVFFSLQRFFVRGLLTGSVKG